MRHKKFLEKELDKLTGQEIMMDKTIAGIESAQQDLNVMKALQQANDTLKEIKSHPAYMNPAQVEALVDDVQDQQAQEQEIADLFGALSPDEVENLEAELDDMMNLGESMMDVNIPDAPTDKIEVRHVQEMGQRDQQVQEEEREMVPA